jgi:hypothetical protein
MTVISLALLLVAVVLLFLAGFGVGAGRFSLLALGLASWALSQLVPALASLA